jgi:hypothetical protein
MSPHTPWFKRLDVWTLAAIVVGGISHYVLVDREAALESAANRHLIEKNIEASEASKRLLEANIGQSKANAEFLSKSVERMEASTTKDGERLALLKQQTDEAKLIDELVDSITPNIQLHLIASTARGKTLAWTLQLKNLGTRSSIVESPTVQVSSESIGPAGPPKTTFTAGKDYTLHTTRPGNIRPGQTLVNDVAVEFTQETKSGDRIYGHINYSMTGYLPDDSKSYKTLTRYYDRATIRKKLSFDSSTDSVLTFQDK